MIRKPAWVMLLMLALAACRAKSDPSLIVASGHVEATDVRVSTKVGGTVQWIGIREGDAVAAGQEVARIDPVDINLALVTARADRDSAAAELRLRLAGAREEDIAEAEAQVRRAEADLEAARKDLERMQGLMEAGSGTVKGRDDARTWRDLATAGLDAARDRLRKLRAGNRPEEIDAARARLGAADARIAQLQQQAVDTNLICPVAGIATERLVEPGELVSPGAVVVVVTNLADAWLTAYIGEPDVGRVRLGQDADVSTDDGQTRKGRITFVSPKAEFTPKNVQTRDERIKLVYRLRISLDNADGLFKPGMPAEAHILPSGARP